jgi:tetratricopeptide (TPR) repeat protein
MPHNAPMLLRGLRSPGVAVAALLILAALALLPGLGGPFMIDDFSTLSGLAALHPEPTAYDALKFAFTGPFSDLGRPLAMLTFVVQWASWDQHPAHFISVSILLHVLNGLLWYGCVRRIQQAGGLPDRVLLAPLAAGIWLLLPMQAATVLYVTQRMTVLATSCALLGTLLYLSGRARGSYVRMSSGVAIAAGLGTLAKETAALMPLLLLALEATLLQSVPRPPRWRAWSIVFLGLPALALLGYLGWRLPDFAGGYGSRTFGMAERLLTEARLLFGYLVEAFAPRPGARLFYDDFPISRSLSAPWTTLPAIAAWLGIVTLAWTRRRAWPVFSFAVAWYLIGHLLESSVIPLEIGFSHRNYLPLLGPALALAAGVLQLCASPALPRLTRLLAAAAGAYVVALAACLALASSLWGQPLAQARHWAARQPDSHRAAHELGRRLIVTGQLERGVAVYRAAALRWPDDALFPAALHQVGCVVPGVGLPMDELLRAIDRHAGGDIAGVTGIVRATAERVAAGGCPRHAPAEALALIDALLRQPRFAPSSFALDYSAVRLLEALGDADAALARIERAIRTDPQVPLLQQAVIWRLERGDVAAARAHLQTLEFSARITPLRRWLFRKEIQGTRQLLDLYESTEPPPA